MNNKNLILCGLLVFALLAGASITPGFAQDGGDGNAMQALQKAMRTSLDADSYTMSMDQDMEQKQSMSNMTINQKTTGSVKYQNPYIYINLTSEVSGVQGSKKKGKRNRQMIGKLSENDELIGLFQKKNGSDNWTPVEGTRTVSFKKMFQRFRNPDTLAEQLENVTLEGEEEVNGTNCQKFTAQQKEEAIQESAKEMLKGASNQKMIQQMDLEVNVKKSDMIIWVRKDSSLIEKIKADTEQDITMSISLRGKQRSFTMNQDLLMNVTFSDYGSTTIQETYRKTVEKMIKEQSGS